MGTPAAATSNFGFLAEHHPRLVMLGSSAELLFHVDPPASISKVRMLAEDLAQLAAARMGVYVDRREAQIDLLRRLRDKSIVTADVHDRDPQAGAPRRSESNAQTRSAAAAGHRSAL